MLLPISRRTVVSGAASLVVALVMALVAMHPGVPVREVELNDGGVWVTNENQQLLAHLNYPSQVLDGAVRTNSKSLDVEQSGSTVFLEDFGSDTFTQVDAAHEVFLGSLDISEDTYTIELGADRLGIVDQVSGNVWLIAADDYASWDAGASDPAATDLPGAVLAMGVNDTAFAASAEAGTLVSVTHTGMVDEVTTTELPDFPQGAQLQISAIGDQPLVLDQNSGELMLPDGKVVTLTGASLALQQPGVDADWVLVASENGLLQISLDGEVTLIEAPLAGGVPARPIWFDDCSYAAWSGAGSFLRDCEGTDRDVSLEAAQLNDADKAVFRTNRDVIVLNNTRDGGLWLPDEDMLEVDNWDEINSTLNKKEQTESEEDSTVNSDDAVQQERSEKNTPPEAEDDTFGVRPGQAAYLPVIMNDSDSDGDVLVATPDSDSSIGAVEQVQNGAALQVQVEADASGSSSFTYTLDDGLTTDQANVTLQVHPFSVNEAPEQLRISTMTVGAGASASLNIAGDWLDPDGDPIYLQSVAFPAGFDVVYRADGTVTVTDTGAGEGITELTVLYSDGQETAEGVLQVTVTGAENEPPIANGDHVITAVGQSVQVSPLANDVDANGDSLRLVSLGEIPSGVDATADTSLGVVTLSAPKAGTYYIPYSVSDGPASSDGVIRMDVVESDDEALPVAMDDVATLPAGGQALVAVLNNDSDPVGGVLTVQSVSTEDGSQLVVALLEHHLLRITAPGGLTEPETITYTVANAAGTSTGHVQVIPVEAVSSSQPPQLAEDNLVVRVGDVGSVQVLDNDLSPAGLKLTVDSELQVDMDEGLGEAFVSDNVVRLRAGDSAGSGTVVYTVRDSSGNVASETVHITVVAMDTEHNTAPHPADVTSWTVSGKKVTIDIPLDGIDAEGDSVSLVDLASSPSLGTAVVGTDSIVYTAGEGASGTDVFSYTVTDRLGATATAQIRVGVAPSAELNQRPVAVADQVVVRPGIEVSVPVLENDVDPDGDLLSLEADLLSAQDARLSLEAAGSRVVVTTPEAEGTYTFEYGVTDGVSDPVVGLVTVVVSKDAVLRAPVARDDKVSSEEARSQAAVTVDVLDNDDDPDGDVYNDVITCEDPGVSVNDDGTLTIETQETQRFVLYTVTDSDGLAASAVVDVAGNTITVPELDTTNLPLVVKAGESIEIPINDYVLARSGHSVQLTDGSKVNASLGWDGSDLVQDSTTLIFGADIEYAGESSVTFEVTDGSDLNDSDGRLATLTLPITVTPADNRSPSITPTEVEVAAGEDPVTVDVSQWASDPDEADPLDTLEFSLSNAPSGVEMSLDGTILTVSADAAATKGDAGSATLTVTDDGGASDIGQVPVSVVGSTRALIQLSSASVTTNAGESVQIDLADYASNPFPDTPIHVVGTPSSSDGSAVSVSGTTLTVTPPAGSHGTAVVTYTVGDKTGDAAREVQGTIEVTVRDVPDAPTGVSASSSSASTAQISWTSGAANGAEITGFTVYDQTQGDSLDCGLVTSCLFSGRTNGIDHTFTVVAHNEVGDSEPSSGATVNIDVVPGTVPQPVASESDGELTLSWDAPTNEGSAISGYTVVLNPGGIEQTVTGTTATFSGLANGTAYTAVVKATNARGSSAEWSASSLAATPYGKPGSVGSVSAEAANLGTSGNTDAVRVTWEPVTDDNGRAPEYYTVTSSNGKSKVVQGGDTRSTTLEEVDTSQSQVTFSVTATNDSSAAGSHTSDAMSATTWVVGKPKVPSGSGLQATGESKTITINTSANGGNGWATSELTVQWSVDQNNWKPVSDLSGNGLTNGSQSTIYLRVVGTKTGGSIESDIVSVGTVTPYGPPKTPTVSAIGHQNNVTLKWDASSSDNGRTISYVNIQTTDSPSTTKKTSVAGSVQEGNGRNQTKKIRAQACYSDGTCSSWSSWQSASTWGDPTWKVTAGRACDASQKSWMASQGDDPSDCTELNVYYYNFDPDKQVLCKFYGITKRWYSNDLYDYEVGDPNPDSNGNGMVEIYAATDAPEVVASDSYYQFNCSSK